MLFVSLSANDNDSFAIYAAHNLDGKKVSRYAIYRFDAKTGKRQDPPIGFVNHRREDGAEQLVLKMMRKITSIK